MMSNLRIAGVIMLNVLVILSSGPASADQGEALRQAARNNDPKQVQNLLNNGADVNSRNSNGFTALIYASGLGHVDVVRLLLEKGADVKAQDSKLSMTALMYASATGHVDIVRLLLEKGADVNTKGYEGWTALMWAARGGHPPVVGLLLERGAEINVRDNAGSTALWEASAAGHTSVVELLRAHGAKP